MDSDDKELKISFLSKKEYECPLCNARFHKEEMLTGGGRLNAGGLNEELHRIYQPTAKYGEVFPLVYQAIVCPECWYATMEPDFSLLPPKNRDRANDDREQRLTDTQLIFSNIDFHESRGLMTGVASQYLVIRCYDFFNKEQSPTIKQGLASLRGAWLFDELNKKFPGQHYDWLAVLFRKKARYFYIQAIERDQKGEKIEGINIGPDTDKNYGYEGVLYLYAYLQFKYGPSATGPERTAALEDAKRIIGRMFGRGKSSKDKPSDFLIHARNLYDAINKELGEMDA